MKKEKREQIYMWILIGISFLSAVPLLILSFYNHPSADDYMYAMDTYHVWNETHSIWSLLKQAVVTSADFYQNWQGLYASAFVLALQPAIFGEGYYALTGFLMLAIIYGGNICFAYYVLHKRLQCTRLESVACGAVLSFVMVQWIPSVVQGLYWYNGTMNYVLFFAILEMFVCALIQIQMGQDRVRNIRNSVLSVVLGVLLAGGNHITAFMGILTAVAIFAVSILSKERGRMLRSGIALVATVGGFLVNVSSPGTKIRQSNFSNTPGAVSTIISAVKTGTKMIDSWMGLAVIIAFLLFLPMALNMGKRIVEEKNFSFRYPLLVLICSIGWCCAMLCPPIYAMGTTGDLRIVNLIYFSFVLLLFVDGFYLCGWYVARQIKQGNQISKVQFSITWCLSVLVLLLGVFISCGEKMSSYQAWLSIKSGEAAQYSMEADVRYEILCSSEGEDVLLQPFSTYPYLLFFEDITEDATNWKNRYMADYFDLNSVRLE